MNFEENGSITVIAGEDRMMILRIVDKLTQEPFDLTAASAINARFKNADQTVLIKNLTAGVAIVSAPAGKISVSLSATETALLNVRENQSFEVEFVIGTGAVAKLTVVQFIEALTVRGRVV